MRTIQDLGWKTQNLYFILKTKPLSKELYLRTGGQLASPALQRKLLSMAKCSEITSSHPDHVFLRMGSILPIAAEESSHLGVSSMAKGLSRSIGGTIGLGALTDGLSYLVFNVGVSYVVHLPF